MSFDAGSIEGSATLDRSPFIEAIRDLQRRADAFSKKKITPAVELKTTRFDVTMNKMRAQLEKLDRTRATVTVEINDRAALARLAAIDAAVKKVDADGRKAASHGGGVGALQIALATLLPTVGPLAAVLTAGLAAGAVGAAGLAVALLGVKDAVKQNTDLGKDYLAQGDALNIMFKQLKQTGAESLFASTADGAKQLAGQFPSLNNQVQEFATIGGDVANNALRLILTMLRRANPEIVAFGNFIDGAAAKANTWASGTGFDKFLQYVDTEGPIIARSLTSFADAIVHLVAGATPLANLTFKGLGVISDFVSKLPPPVIEALAVAWAAWAISMKAADVAAGSFGGKLKGLNIGKVALGAAAAAAAFSLLSGAGESLAESQDSTQAALGSTIRFVTDWKDTVKGAVGAITGNSDAAAAALRRITDPHGVKADAANIEFALKELGDTIENQYIKTLHEAQKQTKLFVTSVNYRQSLTGLSSQLGDVTTQMQKQIEAEQALDGIGRGRFIFVKGMVINQEEYHKALSITNGDYGKAIGLIQANASSVEVLRRVQANLNEQQQNINNAVGEAQAKFKLTAQQVDTYAAAIGVTGDMLARGIVSADNFTAAIGKVAGRIKEANTSNTAWIESIAQFNKSGNTAAAIGDLISAAFRAGRGVTLDWATSNLQAATAAEAVGQVIKDNIKSISDNGTLLGQLVKVGDAWRIQQPKLSAGSLAIAQSLTQQATAAETMAAQTYQNEVATKGASVAANDALGVYLGYRAELIRQAMASGVSRSAAHALADQYLAVPKNVKTFIKQVGKKDVAAAIADLTAALNHFSSIVAKATVGVNGIGSANSQLDQLIGKLTQVNSTKVNPQHPNTGGGASIPGVNAAGTRGGLPDGWFTVGEGNDNTWELGHKQGSKVDLYSNREAKQMLPGGPGSPMVPGFAGGTVNGIRYASDLAYNNAIVRAQQRADKTTASQLKARQTGERSLASQIGGDIRNLGGARNASASSIQSLTNRLLNEVNKAASYHVASSALVRMVSRESAQLRHEVAKRASIAERLKAANEKLSQVNQNIAQEKSTVRSSVLGTFDIGTSGNGYSAGILASLTKAAGDAGKFKELLAKARSMGLNPALVAQLAEEGPVTAGKNLEAIVNSGKDYITQVNTQYHQLGVAADAAGATAAMAKYGAEQARDLAAVRKLQASQLVEQRRINSLLATLSRQFNSLEISLIKASRTKR